MPYKAFRCVLHISFCKIRLQGAHICGPGGRDERKQQQDNLRQDNQEDNKNQKQQQEDKKRD